MKEQVSISLEGLSCEQCRELLSDYIDRELTDAERAAVERHLSDCAKCGTESSRMLGLKKIVQHWGGVRGSGEFRKVLMDKMIRESQQIATAPTSDARPGSASEAAAAETRNGAAERALPPVWVLLAAAVVAAAAYCLVRWLRGA